METVKRNKNKSKSHVSLNRRKFGSVYDLDLGFSTSSSGSRRASVTNSKKNIDEFVRNNSVGGNHFILPEEELAMKDVSPEKPLTPDVPSPASPSEAKAEDGILKPIDPVTGLVSPKTKKKKTLRFDTIAKEMDMNKQEETVYDIGKELWNERRIYNFKTASGKIKQLNDDIDIKRITFAIYKSRDQPPVEVTIENQSRVTVGSSKDANLTIEAEGILPYHVRINADMGCIWLHDLGGVGSDTLLMVTREFPIQLYDIIKIGDLEFRIMQNDRVSWNCAAVVIERLRQSRRQSQVQAMHAKSYVTSVPRHQTSVIGYSEACEICCKDADMSKYHCRLFMGNDDRYYLSTDVDSRLKYTALLVGRAAKNEEVISWSREINQAVPLVPGDEFIVGRTTYQVKLMKVERADFIRAREEKSAERVALMQNVEYLSQLPTTDLKNLAHLSLTFKFLDGEEIKCTSPATPSNESMFYMVQDGEVKAADGTIVYSKGNYWGFDEFYKFLENPDSPQVSSSRKLYAHGRAVIAVISEEILIKATGPLAHLPAYALAATQDKFKKLLTKEEIRSLGKPLQVLAYAENVDASTMESLKSDSSNVKFIDLDTKSANADPGCEKTSPDDAAAASASTSIKLVGTSKEHTDSDVKTKDFDHVNSVANEESDSEEESPREEENTAEAEPPAETEIDIKRKKSVIVKGDEGAGAVKSKEEIEMEELFKELISTNCVPDDIAASNFFITIEAISGPQRGFTFHSNAFLTTIGKHGGGSMIGSTDKSLSNRHTQIEYIDGSYCLRDMNSSTGTFLKLHSEMDVLLNCGDIFQAGNTEFTVLGLEYDSLHAGCGDCSLL
jgi:predicted component of type VI protein secretion system